MRSTKYGIANLLFLFATACLYPSVKSFANSQHGGPVISGKIESMHVLDTIQLQFFDYHFIHREKVDAQLFTCISKDGAFSFRLPAIKQPGYFSLVLSPDNKQKKLLNLYLIEPEDSIVMVQRRDIFEFKGNGVAKYQCRYAMDTMPSINAENQWSATKMDSGKMNKPGDMYNDFFLRDMHIADSLLSTRLALIESYRTKLKPAIVALLKADKIGEKEYQAIYSMRLFLFFPYTDTFKLAVIRFYQHEYVDFSLTEMDTTSLVRSSSYCDFLLERAKLDAQLRECDNQPPKGEYSLKYLYNIIMDTYTGSIRERLLTTALATLYDVKDGADEYLQKVLPLVSHPYFRKMLVEITEKKRGGALAFPFALPDSSGKVIRLKDFIGKVVIIDFWYSGCGACRHLAEGMQEVSKRYANDKTVVFLTISIDKDVNKWKESLSTGKYTGNEEINLYTGGLGVDHPLIQFYHISACPELYIIDKHGKIFSTRPTQPWDADTKLVDQFSQLIEKAKTAFYKE